MEILRRSCDGELWLLHFETCHYRRDCFEASMAGVGPISAVHGNDDLTPAARSNLGYDSLSRCRERETGAQLPRIA
jgi:hypothetical protein